MSILHAKLSASGSERWMKCTGSVKAEESFPDTTSIFAEEGSAAHELAELCLKNEYNAQDYLGKVLPEHDAFIVTQDMADYVQQYLDYVRSLGGTQFYEIRVDFSEWVHEGFGTSDAIVIKDTTMHIIDLKYGKGIKVYANDNSQARLYALGAYYMFDGIMDIKHVVVSIVQPRLDHIDVSDPISIEDLMKFGEYARIKADEALSGNAQRVAGEKQCQFCKAKATCPEQKRLVEKTMLSAFDQLDEAPQIDKLSDDDLRQALDNKKLIVSWLDAVETRVMDKLTSGDGFTGYKLVEGRSLREWTDEQIAASTLLELLGEEAYSKKLISVTQAEKVLGKAKAGVLNELVNKPAGKPTLAPESDKRPAINITADSFDSM